MLRDMLEFLWKQSEEARNPAPHVLDLGARDRLVTLNGTQSYIKKDPPRCSRSLSSLESVAVLLSKHGTENAVTYVDFDGISGFLDDEDRIEQFMMNFESSAQIQALNLCGSGMTQRGLVRVLRTSLAGCVRHESIVPLVRQIEFNVDRGSRSELKTNSESMGRSVEKQVRAKAGEIPDELRMTLPLFSVPHDMVTDIEITCAVEIDMDAEKISLIPTSDSLERERNRVVGEIRERLASLVPEGRGIVLAGRTHC